VSVQCEWRRGFSQLVSYCHISHFPVIMSLLHGFSQFLGHKKILLSLYSPSVVDATFALNLFYGLADTFLKLIYTSLLCMHWLLSHC